MERFFVLAWVHGQQKISPFVGKQPTALISLNDLKIPVCLQVWVLDPESYDFAYRIEKRIGISLLIGDIWSIGSIVYRQV